MSAADRWRDGLEALAIPEPVLAGAPSDPYVFDPGTFRVDEAAPVADTPSRRAALDGLTPGATVIDVGCGGGVGGLGLRPVVAEVVGVDTRAAALADLRESAARLGLATRTVEGAWPDVAGAAGQGDVVISHHVVYNVADIVPFLRALGAASTGAVVVEVTARHPWEWFRALWAPLTGWERPVAPTADDLLAVVVEELGIEPEVTSWTRPNRQPEDPVELARLLARRVCVGPERVDEVGGLISDLGVVPDNEVVTLAWR